MTRTAPNYTVRWRSTIVRGNNRLGSPTPAPNIISYNSARRVILNRFTILIAILFFIK